MATVLGVCLVIVIGFAAVTSIIARRQHAVEDWRRQTSAIALILAENASQQMSSAYLTLDAVTDLVKSLGSRDAAALQADFSSLATHKMLRDKAATSPQIDVISIVSSTGKVINFSRQYPVPSFNLAERDYFKAHRDNAALDGFISTPIRNKVNGNWTFYISRRLNDPAGNFIGLVVLGISTPYYSDFYERASLEGRATITLLRDDFVILTRYPIRDDLMGKANLTGSTHKVVHERKLKHDVVVTDAPRVSKGGRNSTRMGAVRVVDKYPLIINFSIEEEMYLEEWRKSSITTGIVAMASMLAIMLSFTLLVKILRRREADLAVTNELRKQADAANHAKSLLLADMVRQQDALRDASDRLEAIFDHAADGIVTIDEHGNIESFNRAAERIFGYAAAEVIGLPGSVLGPQALPDLLQMAESGDGFAQTGQLHLETNRMRKDGTTFPAELSLGKFHLSGQRKLITIIRDITERRKMEQVKNEFISTVSHELRTPLTSIRGALSLLTSGVLGDLPSAATPLVSIAQQNSERLTRLINDLLDVQKIEAGKMAFHFSTQPLPALMQTACALNRNFGERLGVAIDLLPSVPNVQVKVDPDRFQQVLSNLLSNACKYSSAGGRVTLQALLLSPVSVRIEVSDQGPGIAEAFRERIFQKFSQADSSDTRAREGTGLGLAIAQAIVQQMHGVLNYRSVPGQGATFYIDLPVLNSPG